MTLGDVLRLMPEYGIMHTSNGSTVILGSEIPATLPVGEDRQQPGAAELVDLYSRMGWAVLRAARDAELATNALQLLNGTGIKYRWSDLGPDGYLFALPLGDVPMQLTADEDRNPGKTELLLREEGWAVLATFDRREASELAASLDTLAQHHLVSWKQVEDNGCFLLAARLPETAASNSDNSTSVNDTELGVAEEDAMLESYYRYQGYAIVRAPLRGYYKLVRCIDSLRKRGLLIRYNGLTSLHDAGPDTGCVVAIHCGPEKVPKYGGGDGERDAALRKDGWAVLVVFSPTQAANVRATLERMHAHGVPLEWGITEEGEWGTHIKARCNWSSVDDERHEGDGAIVVVSAADNDEVRHSTCHGLRDLDSAGMDMQWRLCNGVVTVSPWDAF